MLKKVYPFRGLYHGYIRHVATISAKTPRDETKDFHVGITT